MKLPFKPHILALICSAGILAASGLLYVKSQTTSEPTPAAQTAQPAPAVPVTPTAPAPTATPAPVTTTAAVAPPTYTTAQLDQWVAPIALYPDQLLSQVLMASTYPANVVQAVQWSRDNPKQQGDAAIQAVANQPWDPSVKSLVAFPPLLALMGENPEWVQNLGDAFLAQPKDVMDSVQKLRLLAQQTGSLKTTPQQTVTTAPVTVNQNTTVAAPASSSSSSSKTVAAAPAETVIKIEPTDPQVVYVPSYNPSTVYGTWPNTAYPPTYLPPPPGEQFGNSFVNGLGFSLGIATTYALFSNLDWDDDDYHHDYHGGGGYERNGDNNINIDVNKFNRISGQNLQGRNVGWQHNPTYRNGVPYNNSNVAQRYHQTNVAGGLSATQRSAPVNRDAQRQAAATQLQQNKGRIDAAAPQLASRDTQRKASSQQLNQIAQRNNYRGYDSQNTDSRRNAAKQQFNQSTTQQRRDTAKTQLHNPTAQQQQRRDNVKTQEHRQTSQQQQQRRETVQQHRSSSNLSQTHRTASTRPNAFSGNDSRSPSWQAQNQRGQQSLNRSSANREQRSGSRERSSGSREIHRR
ncbi:putative exported protein [Buttiauxella gaviniae ATCC 51604]|uniref:Putative exported protein n=1 Tax=Buttiauxella gaviniae ATCC 51604 TaxID=1354253 RepID=A0A1B7HVJ1_9ENTR|nr:DUF3300 domain-containing protein [Buttiauxella gaviniae]OAT19656.1 putative exported protein [Buttiauxella gaviniae ATCC 51604]